MDGQPPGPTNSRESHHPQAQQGQRSDHRSQSGGRYTERALPGDVTCSRAHRHSAVTQQHGIRGKYPGFIVHPLSTASGTRELNPTRSPRAKDLLMQPRLVQGREQDRKPWRVQLERQAEHTQSSPWTASRGTRFNKLNTATQDYDADTFKQVKLNPELKKYLT